MIGAATAANSTSSNSTTAYKHFDCGVDGSKASTHYNQTMKSMHLGTHKASGGTNRALLHARQSATIQVPTVFHIITKTESAGSITTDMVNAQVAVMNTIYNNYSVFFSLINTTFTVNDTWAVGEGNDDTVMKTALRQGNYSTLNIYFQTDLYGSVLGNCELPTDIGTAPVDSSVYVLDGCNVQAGTMPNGSVTDYNLGKTAVHETGHWLGLLHTFEGYACSGNGDYISDTPMQSTSTDGCPVKPAKDSCPSVAGIDAVNNYMDYSTDACYTNFTPLQEQRIADMWSTYRSGR